jgi:hypothetical protein
VCALDRALSPGKIGELRGKALRRLGYDESAAAAPALVSTLEEALQVAARLARPAGTYRVLPILGTTARSIETEAGSIQSALLARLAGMCAGDASLVFMICTAGEELERSCSPEEPLARQWVFDTVGSELAEMVADMLEEEWRTELSRSGLRCSERFSPGYCDWALEGQAVIAAALDAERVGVCLNSQFVMIPRKSVSAVAVAAQEIPVSAPCVFCARDDCTSRRLPRESGGYR